MIGGTCWTAPFLAACVLASGADAARIEFAPQAPESATAQALGYGAAIANDETLELIASLQALEDANGNGADRFLVEEIRDFYAGRDHELIWMRGDRLRAQAFAVAARLAAAEGDGLDPDAYRLPALTGLPIASAARRAMLDVAISFAAARFATHLAAGRVAPASISAYISQQPERPEVAGTLSDLRSSSDPKATLDMYQPPHVQYHALKAKLAEAHAASSADPVVIPAGRLLKPGSTDDRVPALRDRLSGHGPGSDEPEPAGGAALAAQGGTRPPETDARLYDAALVEAVRAFQSERALKVDGIVGPETLAALNGDSRRDRIAEIITNMERWRWMPRDLGRFHVAVNIPAFRVRVSDDGLTVHSTRVIVGTPQNQTPIFSDAMEHFIVNPYWNVPTSILRNEMLSAIRADPTGYFARHGYQVISRTGRGRVLHPASVNWSRLNVSAIRVRQRPGAANALGRIKFMFPNQHSVYLHDTPSKSLFAGDVRAYSHGCVRVQNPFEFADAVLAHDGEWTAERVRELVGGRAKRVNLTRTIPVHLSYFTLNIEDDGSIRRFADVYGHDRKLRSALGL